jgi:hypothetical protein
MNMILYNIRYRGPFEYDKFILNTLQLCNETKRLEKNLKDTSLTELNTNKEELYSILNELVKEDSLLQKLIYCREKFK